MDQGPATSRAHHWPVSSQEVSLSNQLTPSGAGNPARTPDRPANQRRAWHLDGPPLIHVKCKLLQLAQLCLRCRASLPIWSHISIGLAKLPPAQKSISSNRRPCLVVFNRPPSFGSQVGVCLYTVLIGHKVCTPRSGIHPTSLPTHPIKSAQRFRHTCSPVACAYHNSTGEPLLPALAGFHKPATNND
ncbi:hypothetical protein F4824DRAFT_505102 [Ustulina deusta]|nr:hypothetical protein F4824DRAFT_505102 [Ustulina deusta]